MLAGSFEIPLPKALQEEGRLTNTVRVRGLCLPWALWALPALGFVGSACFGALPALGSVGSACLGLHGLCLPGAPHKVGYRFLVTKWFCFSVVSTPPKRFRFTVLAEQLSLASGYEPHIEKRRQTPSLWLKAGY